MPEEQKPENTDAAPPTPVPEQTPPVVAAAPVAPSAAAPQAPILGHNDTQLRTEQPQTGPSRAWVVVLLTGLTYVLVAAVPQLLYAAFFRPDAGDAPKTMADVSVGDFIGPLLSMAVGYFVAPLVAIFVIAYSVRYFAKAKEFISFLYITLTAIAMYGTYYMFFIGVSAFMPGAYDTLAPLGIILAVLFFAPLYYTAMYFLLKYIQKEKYKFDPSSPEYASYQLLENTNRLCRLLSYVGIVGAALIPLLVSVY